MISVIVPIYMAEKVVSRCIESILKQTYKDWELLLIVDGSPDKSAQICQQYAMSDRRIRVYIAKENKGVSSARNLGIQKASGEFIIFVDCDDFIESGLLQHIWGKSRTGMKNQLLIYTMRFIEPNRMSYRRFEPCSLSAKAFTAGNLARIDSNVMGSPCNKLYIRSNLIENYIIFPESLSYAEDLIFNLRYLRTVDTVVVDSYCGYNYDFTQAVSLSKRKNIDLFAVNQQIIQEIKCVVDFFDIRSTDEIVEHKCIDLMLTAIRNIAVSDGRKDDKCRQIKEIFHQHILPVYSKSQKFSLTHALIIKGLRTKQYLLLIWLLEIRKNINQLFRR